MITMVYVSAAVQLFGERELSDLLAVSRRNNARRNLTGMLCYADGNFMQALEGAEADVDALEEVLKTDPRHYQMRRLVRYPIAGRQFGGWSMALNRLGSLPPEDRASCTTLMAAPLPAVANSGQIAIKLLNSFRSTMA